MDNTLDLEAARDAVAQKIINLIGDQCAVLTVPELVPGLILDGEPCAKWMAVLAPAHDLDRIVMLGYVRPNGEIIATHHGTLKAIGRPDNWRASLGLD